MPRIPAWLLSLLLVGVAVTRAQDPPEAHFASMSPAEVRAYERETLRRVADLALIPPVPNTEPLPQYDYDKLDYGMTIGIERTPKGRLWACWVAGGDSPKAFFVLATSDDDGETWSKPRLVLDSHSRTLPRDRSILVGNLWTDPLGRLWLFFDQSMEMFDGRGGLWATVCENPDAEKPAWSPPRRIWHGVMLNKPTVLSTGEWMLPISLDQRDGLGATDPPQMFGPFRGLFPELDPFRGANVFVSTDQGATWQRRGAVTFPNPDWHEHMIVERRDGSLWMLARTRKGIMQSTSTDGGRTWAEPTEPPGIRQPNARFHVRRLASGKLLLVKHGDRIDAHEGRVQLSAWLSDDDGATWQGGLVLDERKGVSYPDGFQAPDGTIFISYDRNRATDGEILLARFTEADVLAKQLTRPKSKLKMLISRPLAPRAAASPHALTAAADLASLQPPHHIGPPQPEQAATNRAFSGLPSLAVAPRGRLWATWYAGVTPAEDLNNYVVLSTSDDGGSTWQEVLVVDPDGGGPVRAFDPELWVSPDGRLFFFWAQMEEGRRDTEHGVWCIETATPDAARPAWSQPRRIGDGVMMCKPIVLSSGEWMLPISRWKEHQESARCVVSADAGKTWLRRGGCNVPADVRNYDEHMFVERKDGTLWLLVRTTYGIGQSVSADRGKTWPELSPSDILHTTSRFFVSRLASGNLLLVKHGPLDARTSRSHLTAYVSADDGRTWTGGLMLDERPGVSYPDGQETPDGLIRIIYDYNRVRDRNILMATFREQDVAAGKDVSGGVRLRQLVSKASGGLEKPAASKAAAAANADGQPLPKARRAWMEAPAEKQAAWQAERDAIHNVDLAGDVKRQVVIARGTPEPEAYHAHPTTALLGDGKTMFCVWNIGHGGHAGPMARSDDGGLSWTRIDERLPPNYVNFRNCPSIYRLTDPAGKERLWVFAARTATNKENPKPITGRQEGYMPRIVSHDAGKTWHEEPPLGPRVSKDHHLSSPFRNIMTFSSIVRLKDGSSLGMFHRGEGSGESWATQVMQSVTRDGGFAWSEPVIACDGTQLDGKHPCEPYVFRSPDGMELCCLMRENRRSGTSLVMFSRDEGKTWSRAVDAPWGLTGDRHHGIALPDGRLVIVFRNASPNSRDKAGFIAWVGTYDDIRQGRPGQYRVSLLQTFKDGFYPGIHLLPDGTIVATTYATYRADDVGCSIVSVRFRIAEIDALAAANGAAKASAAPE